VKSAGLYVTELRHDPRAKGRGSCEGIDLGWDAMIRIKGDEEAGYLTMVTCDECHGSMIFKPQEHGLWVGSARQVRVYMVEHKGWVWDPSTGAFYCPEHFR
jgi:hypothetical protein